MCGLGGRAWWWTETPMSSATRDRMQVRSPSHIALLLRGSARASIPEIFLRLDFGRWCLENSHHLFRFHPTGPPAITRPEFERWAVRPDITYHAHPVGPSSRDARPRISDRSVIAASWGTPS